MSCLARTCNGKERRRMARRIFEIGTFYSGLMLHEDQNLQEQQDNMNSRRRRKGKEGFPVHFLVNKHVFRGSSILYAVWHPGLIFLHSIITYLLSPIFADLFFQTRYHRLLLSNCISRSNFQQCHFPANLANFLCANPHQLIRRLKNPGENMHLALMEASIGPLSMYGASSLHQSFRMFTCSLS